MRIPFSLSVSRAIFRAYEPNVTEAPIADCYPATLMPGLSRLYLDYCAGAGAAREFHAPLPKDGAWHRQQPARPVQWAKVVELLARQNPSEAAKPALAALAAGAGTVLTGQQVTLFGGPLFTPFKAAAAIARARQATQAARPHAAIFWLATEDHDFAEINHVDFPSRREIERLVYTGAPAAAQPVGSVVLDESITGLVEQASPFLGPSEAADALDNAYRPGRTFAEAFAEFYRTIFAAQGLLVVDASGREFHRLGAPVLRDALERADELHSALLKRNQALEAAGYHAQVAVTEQSSLLFLIDEKSGARVALKRTAATVAEPDGLWQAGSRSYSTGELVAILEAEPERISPSALLRPVFQDFLFGTSLVVGGPAEIAYFTQSAVLYERILGRQTPAEPRFSATLITPAVGELLRKHGLTLEQVLGHDESSLARLLAERVMPAEGRERLASAGKALDAELAPLVEWMKRLDEGLGRSGDTAASKMQYQMSRLRALAENFLLQKEDSLARHAQAITLALHPDGAMQERVHGAAYYFAHYGLELAETLCRQAEKTEAGAHSAIYL